MVKDEPMNLISLKKGYTKCVVSLPDLILHVHLCHYTTRMILKAINARVSYRGGRNPPPLLPAPLPQPQFSLIRNLEFEYGYYIRYLHVTERKHLSSKCLDILSQIVSEAI